MSRKFYGLLELKGLFGVIYELRVSFFSFVPETRNPKPSTSIKLGFSYSFLGFFKGNSKAIRAERVPYVSWGRCFG